MDNFLKLIEEELATIEEAGLSKGKEKVIEKFIRGKFVQAVINKKKYFLFNSNDYLGLRFHTKIIKAEEKSGKKWGTGPGAVRFISGTLKIYKDLEKKIAAFHQKEEAMIFSSSFVANQGVIFPLIKGQRKNSLINDNVLIISDELNHRSIIDAIRLAKLNDEQKVIYPHMDINKLEESVKKAINRFDRILIITDGVFSMLGEIAPVNEIVKIKKYYQKYFKNGILTIIDDAHGVGVLGTMGSGTEEFHQTKVDLIIGTFGKAFGTDGGYVVGPKLIIDYLRESSAPYIYSNPMSPATAGASLKAIEILESKEGRAIKNKLIDNINYFKKQIKNTRIKLAAESIHPIQPVLVGNPLKAKRIAQQLFSVGYLTTAISYPVVPFGKDEIRIQINANHSAKIINNLISYLEEFLLK